MGPWLMALGTPRLSGPAPTLASSVGTNHSQTLCQSQGDKALTGSDKGLKCPPPNAGLQAGREPGTSRCVPWGARGGVRHLGSLRLGEHPRWGLGFFVTSCYSWCSGHLVRSRGAVGYRRGQGPVCLQAGGRLGATACSTRAGHGSVETRGHGSLTMPSMPGANSPLNVPCRGVPASETTAVAANCRGAAEWGCRRCLKKIQSKIRQCQSISATPLGTGS